MATFEVRSAESPDETRAFQAHGGVAMVSVAGRTVGRGTFEPGWRWSQDVKPIAGTDTCQTAHFGYVLSGRMHVVMDDGTEGEIGPGDVVVIPPGHDAWTVGDEACVMVDFGDVETYARRS
ncbi:MAG: cupin domain-containing protein [Solirubrobacteraceae bacterium]